MRSVSCISPNNDESLILWFTNREGCREKVRQLNQCGRKLIHFQPQTKDHHGTQPDRVSHTGLKCDF